MKKLLPLLVLLVVGNGLQAVTAEADVALKIKNKGSEKIHVLVIQTNDFRHILDAGGWTNKSVNALLNLTTDVLTFLPDVERSVKKGQKDLDDDRDTKKPRNVQQYEAAVDELEEEYSKKEEALEKSIKDQDKLDKAKDRLMEDFKKEKEELKRKYNITDKDKKKRDTKDMGLILTPPANKAKITKDDIKKAELWIGATNTLLKSSGAFLGNILPHVAIAAISKKDYVTQLYPGMKYSFFKGKKPQDSVMHLKDLVVAIFPDDGDGVAEFYKPLFVRSFDPQKYNAIYYGPTNGHATFLKIDFATGEIVKATEKSFLPVEMDKKTESVKVPDEGEDVLDEVREAREASL